MANNYTRIKHGLNLDSSTVANTASVEADVNWDATNHKIEYHDDSAVRKVVSEDGTATLTNKILSGNTAVNLISGSGTLTLNTTGTITVPNGTDTLVGRTTTDTLTNKTLSGNTAATLISGSGGTLTLNTTGTITIPSTTDTLVAKTTTDTLTNKTLTSPTITGPTVTGSVTSSGKLSVGGTTATNTQLYVGANSSLTNSGTAYGVRLGPGSGLSSVTEFRSLYIEAPSEGSSNRYGIFIDDISGGSTNNYNIFSNGNNFLALAAIDTLSTSGPSSFSNQNINTDAFTDTTQYTYLTGNLSLQADNGGFGGAGHYTNTQNAGINTSVSINNIADTSLNVTNLYGLNVASSSISGSSATITEYAGMKVQADSTTGITNKYGLYIGAMSGAGTLNASIRLDSSTTVNGSGTVTISNLRPAGTSTATISGWLNINLDGNTVYIPYWR